MCICIHADGDSKWGISAETKNTTLTYEDIESGTATASEAFILMCRRISDNSDFSISSDITNLNTYITYKVLRRFSDTDDKIKLLTDEYLQAFGDILPYFQSKYVEEHGIADFSLSIDTLYIAEEMI